MGKVRIEQLTFTRFLAAISIVIFHFGKDVFPFNHSSVAFIFEQANNAVSYFFMLSGYVMILSYQNKNKIDFSNFIKRRIARIFPVYFIALLATVSIYITINTVQIKDFVLNLMLLQSWIPGKATTLNYPGWSLSVELFFYAIFPLLFNFFYKKYKQRDLFLFGCIFWIGSQIIFNVFLIAYPGFTSYIFYFPLLHVNAFILGNLGGVYFLNCSLEKNKSYELWIFSLVFLTLFFFKYPFGVEYHNGFLAILFLPLIILISLSSGMSANLFKKKFLVFLGEISYSIYILQLPVWLFFSDYRLFKYFNIEKGSNLNFYVRTTILIIISSITFLLIEKPARKFIVDNNSGILIKKIFNKYSRIKF